ncbi:MAG: 1-acyl-sn-glycerol-3-phosphate acyltransferase [Actinobacteria bacterium]|nr:1-acyl-sn-glycerol-3-phosphate acyltransferase [Actinomycetota bacterium]
MRAEVAAAPNYGIDADRVLGLDAPLAALRRRFDGRYAVDELGADAHLMDVLAPLGAPIRVEVEHAENLPKVGPALLVANRSFGLIEPVVLVLAVRRATGRRLRVVGAPNIPVLGTVMNKLGAIGSRVSDVASLLRAGHLAAAPLAPTWLRTEAGRPPRGLVAATLGFPVIPVAVRAGGPLGLPLRPWRVVVGEPLLPPAGTEADDQLAAAEISEAVRDAVHELVQHS